MTRALFTDRQIAAIAREYDGETETIDRLIKKYGGRRHNIVIAAKRGGYKTTKCRRAWTKADDDYLRENYGKVQPEELCAHLDRTRYGIYVHVKRLGISTRNNPDYTVYDLEHLTKLDHRMWRQFIERGWLKSYEEFGLMSGKVWSRRVKLEQLHAFLRDHPEIFDYRGATKYVRAVLELDKLPDPPRFMRITCKSDAWQDGKRPIMYGEKYHHGELTLRQTDVRYSLKSCAADGGVDFWAAMYQVPNCPRCGCKCTRFSDKVLFTDQDPDAGETLNAIAGKLGLTWRDGRFYTAQGKLVTEEELLRFVFSTKRNAGKAFTTFRRLLQAGMTIAPANPVPADRLMPSLLKFKLRAGAQQDAFDAFVKTGNIGVYWPPGIGKMYFLGTIYASVEGWHELFVHTHTIREQWIAFFREHARHMKVAYVKSPHHWRVDLMDDEGNIRSVVRIFSYATRHDFAEGKPAVVGYDEAQFLPGNRASRLALIQSEFRVGLSATPFREDGRADLIQIMTGEALGDDWKPFKDSGQIADVPVRVLIVKDLEHKHQALGQVLNGHRTIVFSDAIEDGKRIEAELGIPFIHAGTKDRLGVLAQHRSVCMSRVGDCGIDVQDLEEVIEFRFHHGSRAQSLQRLGRLLHSRRPLRHTVLMTTKEFSLYHKRLTALEAKGFRLRIDLFKGKQRPGRPPAAKPVSHWVQALGIKAAPAPRAINQVSGRPYETTSEKRERVMRRIRERQGAMA